MQPSTSTQNDIRTESAAAARAHYEQMAAAAAYPRLLSLLVEARAALAPEYCGTLGSLAGRIDDLIHTPARQPEGELVLESYGNGYAWLRP